MPLYDYRCRACSKVTEVRHGFREAHAEVCPACGGELARVFSPTGIVFKGSGFYLTDSRKASETAKAAVSKDPSTPAKPSETATTSEPGTATPAAAPAAAAPAAAPSPSSGGGESTPKKSESSAA